MNKGNFPGSLTNSVLWLIFGTYIFTLSYAITHHELWGGEIHSWNIAKASHSFSDLISNTRYEGHPPAWYTVLWIVSKFTHNVTYIQVPQFILISSVVFLLLFFSPFPLGTKILIPFGYYFLFEYAVLSRNYAIGLLCCFCICLIIRKNFPYKILIYYFLLFLMSNTHLLAAILAGSLHCYFLFLNVEQKKKTSIIALHTLFGVLIFLPALYFIFPPGDSDKNVSLLITRLDFVNHLRIIFQAPMRAFIPIPAWWKYNFRNTQFLLEVQSEFSLLKIVSVLVWLGVFAIVYFILKNNRKCLVLFTINTALTFVIAILFPIHDMRYVGFIYIGFLSACWLYCYENPLAKRNKWFLNILLIIHMAGGVFIISKDIKLPFSNSYRVNELLKEIPPNEKIITDYWCINALSAFTDKPFYCIELNRELSFVLLNAELAKAVTNGKRYNKGMTMLFREENLKTAYMISIQPPAIIPILDSQLVKSFNVKLIDKREGAIEKGNNLYLYQISSF